MDSFRQFNALAISALRSSGARSTVISFCRSTQSAPVTSDKSTTCTSVGSRLAFFQSLMSCGVMCRLYSSVFCSWLSSRINSISIVASLRVLSNNWITHFEYIILRTHSAV